MLAKDLLGGWVDGWKILPVENKEKKDKLFQETLQAIHLDNYSLSHSIASPEQAIDRWRQIVDVYTRRSLTQPTDRLPAISGIAQRFANILHDDYYAGLWGSHLARELLGKRHSSSRLNSRPSIYQAPSWSWAAISNPISYLRIAVSKVVDSESRIPPPV
jgi:hypothetical protein